MPNRFVRIGVYSHAHSPNTHIVTGVSTYTQSLFLFTTRCNRTVFFLSISSSARCRLPAAVLFLHSQPYRHAYTRVWTVMNASHHRNRPTKTKGDRRAETKPKKKITKERRFHWRMLRSNANSFVLVVCVNGVIVCVCVSSVRHDSSFH